MSELEELNRKYVADIYIVNMLKNSFSAQLMHIGMS